MRFSTEFLEYLKHSVADTIFYNDKKGDEQFKVEGSNFKKYRMIDSNKVYQKFS